MSLQKVKEGRVEILAERGVEEGGTHQMQVIISP